MAEWINNDGLRVRFDVDKIKQTAPRGEAPGAGEDRVIDFIVDVKTLKAGQNRIEGVVITRNSTLAEIQWTPVEDVTGMSAFDVGLKKYDGSELDYDGIASGAVPGTVGVRTKVVKGGTGAGALLGTTLTLPGDLVITPTGTPSAGKLAFRVKLFVAGKDANPGKFA